MSTPLPSHAAKLPPHALGLLSRLDQHDVELVLIGELAAAVHGVPWSDDTVEIVPARFGRNLERLARSLRSLGARTHAGAPPPGDDLRALGRWDLTTQLGGLIIDFEPPATAGHLDLFAEARRVALAPRLEVEVAALEDLIRIAELRDSAIDRAALPLLRRAAERATVSDRS